MSVLKALRWHVHILNSLTPASRDFTRRGQPAPLVSPMPIAVHAASSGADA